MTSLILRDADFSQNGIYNPIINWFYNFMDDSDISLPRGTRIGCKMDTDLVVAIFKAAAGKKVRYIKFRLCFSLAFTTDMVPTYINVYNYDSSTNTCTKIGNSIRYTIDSNSADSIMFIDLGQEYEIRDGIAFYGFDSQLGDRDFSILCGMTMKNDKNGECRWLGGTISGTLDSITGTKITNYGNWIPDIKIGN